MKTYQKSEDILKLTLKFLCNNTIKFYTKDLLPPTSYTYIYIGVSILGFFMGKIIAKRSIDISFLLCLIYALISFGLMLLIGSLKYFFYYYMYCNFTYSFSFFIESLGDIDSLFVSIGTFISFLIGEFVEYDSSYM